MTRNASAKKKRKSQLGTPVKVSMETGSDSDGAIADHPDTNAINRTLSNLYMTNKSTPHRDISMREEKEEAEANKEIEKALKRQERLAERYNHKPPVSSTFENLGGLAHVIQEIQQYLDPSQNHLKELGSGECKRILISGVAGVGKSTLVDSIINHYKLPPLKCKLRFLCGTPSEIESACRNLFNYARSIKPCIIIMDKLDRMVGKPVDSKTDNDREIRIEALIDAFEELNKENSNIIIIGITNSVDSLDYSFMSAARFKKKIFIDVPDEKSREAILKVLCKDKKISDDVNFEQLGSKTPGYVGADLSDLVDEAVLLADERIRRKNSSDDFKVEMKISCQEVRVIKEDFHKALKKIKPSLKRDGFASIPNVTWADIGACDHIRRKLMSTILLPVKCPAFMEKTLRGKTSCGILLHGPPGCGKTSIAKAIANEGDISFISVKGPEVLNKYVGESERKIRDIFEKAEKAKPCVIFFDEIDALCTERAASERSNVTQSVLSQILTEMDGFDNQSCLVLAATNRLDVLDSAILRPGRFDNHIFVGIPDASARLEILKAITRNNKPPLSSEVCLKSLAYDDRLRNFTGADLRGLIERAHSNACSEMFDRIGTLDFDQFVINKQHIESALRERGASISDEMLQFYLKSAKKFGLVE